MSIIKIQHKNPEVFQGYLICVLNVACVVAGHGHIPTEREQANPDQYGRYWWREDKRYHLCSTNNDWWANIQHESENSMTLSFSCRYGRIGLADALCTLLELRFPDFVTIEK